MAGNKIYKDIEKYGKLSLSESIVTEAYNLHSKYVIHVVLPKYTINYHNACEATFHLAIRNVIDVITFTNNSIYINRHQ